MKLVQINVVCNGSTGKIMCDIAKEADKYGFNTYCFYGRGLPNKHVNCIKIGNKISVYFHLLLARLGFNGYGSYFATKNLVKKLKEINPDVIHLHNIHGYYVNLKVLFKYLKSEYTGKIVWTLHDCWTFTGHCSYFTMANCNKWKTQCKNCPQLKCYPSEFFDTTDREYKLKKRLFTELNNLTLVTPSKWLKELVQGSFLKDYQTNVIENGIDLSIFKNNVDSSIKEKYSIPNNKKILLGVANIWEKRKGLDVFIELSKMIDEKTVIVLVGLTKKQIRVIPNNIIGIERTNNVEDLVKIYSISDVFINPSLEETFSLVTAEAMACGLPVVVSKTSAIKYLVEGEVGKVVEEETAKCYLKNSRLVKKDVEYLQNYAKKYDVNRMIKEYYDLYKEK